MAAWSIVRFKLYQIELAFADGASGVAALARVGLDELGDCFDPLCDEAVFAKA